MEQLPLFQTLLREELERRKRINSKYSLRSFAKQLDLAPSRLSEIISGKQGLSEARARDVANRLKLEDAEEECFVESVLSLYARSRVRRESANKRLDEAEFNQIDYGKFELLSHWKYFAVLELLRIFTQKGSVAEISKKIGLPRKEVTRIINLLKELRFVGENDDSYLVNEDNLEAEFTFSSRLIQNYHQELVGKAQRAIEEQSKEQRYLSALTIVINEEDFSKYKDEIIKFRKKINLLNSAFKKPTKKGSKVYCLSAQFFELREGEKDEESI